MQAQKNPRAVDSSTEGSRQSMSPAILPQDGEGRATRGHLSRAARRREKRDQRKAAQRITSAAADNDRWQETVAMAARVYAAVELVAPPPPPTPPQALVEAFKQQARVATLRMVQRMRSASDPQQAELGARLCGWLADLPPHLGDFFAIAQAAPNVEGNIPLDWAELQSWAVEIANLPRLQDQLKEFSWASGTLTVFNYIAGPLQLAAGAAPVKAQVGGSAGAAAGCVGFGWDLLEQHISNAADIAAGRVLCDVGPLVLHYRLQAGGRIGDAELVLSRRWPSGFLSYWPPEMALSPFRGMGTPPVPPTAIKRLRAFVAGYQGPVIHGEVSPHPDCDRLCRLAGLQIRGGLAYLQPAKSEVQR